MGKNRWLKRRYSSSHKKNYHFKPLYIDTTQDKKVQMTKAIGCTVYMRNNEKINTISIYNPKGENKKNGKFIDKIVKTLPTCGNYLMLGDLNEHKNY
jgi:hypothetical protein